jgi:anaerobic ribonucleoside-triphosphate reductase activating protein
MKYVDTLISFSEIPDEITLCINISNCPNNCKGCHSPYLANDIGETLDTVKLHELIYSSRGISCVCFMGGDATPEEVDFLAFSIRLRSNFPKLKTAWYSGKSEISDKIHLFNFDYIKIGPYIEELGGLDSKNTNQIMYKVEDEKLIDITYRFQHDSQSII